MTCKDCDATLTTSDRFCPACGTPNAACKFQPKFGPALRIIEPHILTENAPDGSPSCPSCHRLIELAQKNCRGCGMELEVAWKRIERVDVLDAWRSEGVVRPFRSPGRLARSAQALLLVSAITALLVGVANWWLYARSVGHIQRGLSNEGVLQLIDGLTVVMAASMVVSYGVLVAWMWRGCRNLPALAVADLRFGPGWAIAGWLVPGLMFFRPKQVIDDLWRASHPLTPPFSTSWRVSPPTAWSMAWWAGLLVGAAFGITSRLTMPATDNVGVGMSSSFALAGVAGLTLAGSSFCLHLIVGRVSERQDTRAVFVLATEDGVNAKGASDVGATPEPEREPVLLVQPSSRDAVYGRY